VEEVEGEGVEGEGIKRIKAAHPSSRKNHASPQRKYSADRSAPL
jgi:hypothetical protein